MKSSTRVSSSPSATYVGGLHAQERLGVAGVATGLGLGGPLQDRDAGTVLGGRAGGGQAGDAAADHDDVVV